MKIKLKIKIKTFVGEFSRSRSSWTDFLQTQNQLTSHEQSLLYVFFTTVPSFINSDSPQLNVHLEFT